MRTNEFDNDFSIGFIGNLPIEFTSVIITKTRLNEREQYRRVRFD